jgi:hypothetical protein
MTSRGARLSTYSVDDSRQRRSASRTARLLPLALAAAFFVLSAPAAHADGPAIATIALTPGWITFGQAIPQGAAHDALKIGALDTQTDVKTRWPDGSIRFAVLTANVTGAGSYTVMGGSASAASPIAPSLPAASATFTIGGVAYTATLPNALSADRWLSGSLAYEGRSIVAPVSSADGHAHPFLRVIFDTRVYADGNGRVDVTVENVLDQVGASTVTYDVVIAMSGAPVFSKAAVEHYYLTRWRKVFDVGTAPRSVITPDMMPFNVSRALPKYLPLVGTQVDVIPSDGTYDILRSGTLDPNMPAHGGNPDLAPFPDWTARYLVHKDPIERAFVLANGDLSGSWPVHVREPEGGTYSGVGPERLLSLNQRPLVWYDERAQTDFMQKGVTLPNGTVTGDTTPLDYIKGTPLPIREYGSTDPGPGQSPLIPDNAHQPSLAYVPYLLTGDRYYADEMAFWANYGMLRTRPADGVRGVGGILANNEVRGYGWALRNVADAAAYYPGTAVSQYLSQKVEANLQFLDAYANSQDLEINPQRVLWIGYRPEPGFISLWEQTYLAYAIDRANKQGFTGGLAHRNAIALLQLRLFTSPSEYPREAPAGVPWSAPYLVGVGTVPNLSSWNGFSYYKTMTEFFSATTNVPTAAVCFDPTHNVQVPDCLQRDFAGFYGPEARLNLMMLIDSGVTEAKEPYDYLFGSIGSDNSYCAVAYGGTGDADRPDLTCRSGWALDFYPDPPVASAVSCLPGSYLASPTDAACTLAPAGSFVGAPGATAATLCAAGTYSNVPGAIACTAAPLGSFVSETGATSATLCATGSYSDVTGAMVCTSAPAGSFVSGPGATSPTLCAAGTYSSAGAISCTAAPAGSFVAPGATTPTLCPVGTFSALSGATSCTPAPAGSFVSITGATTATPCALGTFSASTGLAACTLAPAGSFVDSTGATAAIQCALGRFSASTGATSCTPAPAGSYVGTIGAITATLCPVGQYSALPGAPACTSAPAGSFVGLPGATTATPCALGTFSSSTGAVACTPAPAGSFVSAIGATGATLCAAGTFSASTGAIVCTAAPAGSFVGATGATAPSPCPAGTTSLAGATSCAAIGTITNPLGAFVVFSNDMTWLKEQTTVVTGDVGANTRAKHGHSGDEGNDGDADDVTVRIGAQVTMLQPDSRVVGDTVRLSNKASVYNVVDNVLINKSRKATVSGTITTPMTIPFLTLPTLPTVTPGTAAVEVAKGSTRTLGPGAYGRIHVSAKATLILTGGLYQMLSLDVDQAATVIFRAATEIRIKDELATGNKARLIADPASSGLTAKNLVIYVAGSDQRCIHNGEDEESNDHGGPTAAHIGENNVVAANIYAPNGTIWIKSKTQAAGAFIGDDVRVGQNVTLTLDSAFR